MKITQALLDELTAKAKASPRFRMNLDLRDSAEDTSQRMLNAIEPGSPRALTQRSCSGSQYPCRPVAHSAGSGEWHRNPGNEEWNV